VLVTLGAEGARWLDARGAPVQVLPPAVNAIDTTGAGDVFHAALAIGLAEHKSTAAAVSWACAAAAFKCERGFGAEGAPTGDELEAWLRRRAPR
jgi:sulfofructose kinase